MKKNNPSFQSWLSEKAFKVEKFLDEKMPTLTHNPNILHEAMRYAVLNGGKRIRGVLLYAVSDIVYPSGISNSIKISLDYGAAALELMHAYSLVHDDMPCMDNDTIRRGKPTVHVKYDEAIAILVGDALQTLSFEFLTEMPLSSDLILESFKVLSKAAGSKGMIGGQSIDLKSIGDYISKRELRCMHSMKTGAIIKASLSLGCIISGADLSIRKTLEQYGEVIGLAFQVSDDILDVTSRSGCLGKTAGKDSISKKPTYVSTLGLKNAISFLKKLHKKSLEFIKPMHPNANRLEELADFVVSRDH